MSTETDTRPDTPLGHTYDAHGNVMTYKDSLGYWYEFTRDSEGRELTFEDAEGRWHKYTRDRHGWELTYDSSAGVTYEYTRDDAGNELTFTDSSGTWVRLAHCDETDDDLHFNAAKGEYRCGLRTLRAIHKNT